MTRMTAVLLAAVPLAGCSAIQSCPARFAEDLRLPSGVERARATFTFEASSRDDREVNAFLEAMAARPLEQQGVETPPDPKGGLRLVMPYTSRTPLSSNQLQPLLQDLCGLSKGAVSLKSLKLSLSPGPGR